MPLNKETKLKPYHQMQFSVIPRTQTLNKKIVFITTDLSVYWYSSTYKPKPKCMIEDQTLKTRPIRNFMKQVLSECVTWIHIYVFCLSLISNSSTHTLLLFYIIREFHCKASSCQLRQKITSLHRPVMKRKKAINEILVWCGLMT